MLGIVLYPIAATHFSKQDEADLQAKQTLLTAQVRAAKIGRCERSRGSSGLENAIQALGALDNPLRIANGANPTPTSSSANTINAAFTSV